MKSIAADPWCQVLLESLVNQAQPRNPPPSSQPILHTVFSQQPQGIMGNKIDNQKLLNGSVSSSNPNNHLHSLQQDSIGQSSASVCVRAWEQ